MAGATWTTHESHKRDPNVSPACPECGHPKGDLFHLVWQCPCYAQQRTKGLEALGDLGPHGIPKCLALH
eukprot:9450057-Alexandrium_andersonii.AAC.1